MKRSVRLTALPLAAFLTIALAAGPAAAAKSDTQIAKAGVLVASDLPNTWTSSPPDNSGSKQVEKIAAKVPSCKEYLAFSKANKGNTNAESRDFSLGDDDLSNKAFVYKSNAAAQKAMQAIGASDVADCLTQVFQKVLDRQIASSPKSAKTVKSATASIAPVSDLTGVGDDAVGYAGGLDIQLTDGTDQQLLVGVLAVRTGRALTTFSFSAPPTDSGFSTVLDSAITASTTRTKDALA